MLHCKKCHVQINQTNIERQQGDWVIPCPYCGTKNIIAPAVVGWRD